MCRTCSPRSGNASPRTGAASGWACGSRARSSRRTAAACASSRGPRTAPRSTSPCPSPSRRDGGRTEPSRDVMHRILVVEDTPAFAEALERNLTLEGHQVLLATRAAEAIARVTHESPDLVVLDLGLPDRD